MHAQLGSACRAYACLTSPLSRPRGPTLCFETYICSGGCTTVAVLYSGRPVLTLPLRHFLPGSSQQLMSFVAHVACISCTTYHARHIMHDISCTTHRLLLVSSASPTRSCLIALAVFEAGRAPPVELGVRFASRVLQYRTRARPGLAI